MCLYFRLFPLVPGNNSVIHLMLETYSPNDIILIQSTHYSTLWVVYKSPNGLTHDSLKSHSLWITTFLASIPIIDKSSLTVTTTLVTTTAGLYVSHAPCVLSVLHLFVGQPTNLNCGLFSTGINVFASILYLVNSSNDGLSFPYFTIAEFFFK